MIKSILNMEKKDIQVFDRKKKHVFTETVYGENAMKVFYGNKIGLKVTDKFLTNKLLSRIYGAYNDSSLSRHKIEDFVKKLDINIHECEKDVSDYESFNDFFIRRLKPDARPLNTEENSFICPGDGRLLVFPKIDEETISYLKWAPIKLHDLFNFDESLVETYTNGSCGILRLCPTDYHRFHFPLTGKAGITRTVPGVLHSVSPYSLEEKIPVYTVNKRTMCEIETPQYGKVLMMEVGALFVGTIVQTYRAGCQVKKGDEKGYFKFGGSTCVFFTQKGILHFDQDLIEQSRKGRETLVQMGEKIGTVQSH
jgi:phosphatidylserine decarboxylase